jgi:hypothetical protein
MALVAGNLVVATDTTHVTDAGLVPPVNQVLPAALSGGATLSEVIAQLNAIRAALIASTLFS